MGIAIGKKDKYLLTLRFSFEAFDDVDARLTARQLLSKAGVEGEAAEHKLQKIFKGKEPQKIVL